MTKAEKRVAIAKDVLKHLKVMRVTNGYYIIGGLNQPFNGEEDAQEKVEDIAAHCQVCALGGMMISHVRLWDKVKMAELGYSTPFSSFPTSINTNREHLTLHLGSYFSVDQLNLIENAYERASAYPSSQDEDAVKFGNRYENNAKRLGAIMRNIVKNGGTFVPKKRKVGAK